MCSVFTTASLHDLKLTFSREYGSYSFEVRIIGKKSKLENITRENNIQPLHYDSNHYGGIPDQGFVTLVHYFIICWWWLISR